jgi:hypothetical protein
MLKSFFQKIRFIGIFSIIFGLIMANFFHAVLMDFGATPVVASSYGACHGHASTSTTKAQGSQNDPLPCCADKKSSEATTLFALFDFSKLARPSSTYLVPVPPADSGALPRTFFVSPPNQVALDKIILRI